MTSMIHSRGYSPVVFQLIRVSTDLYGLLCNVFIPSNIPTGFNDYSDITYSKEIFLSQKLLIPKAVVQTLSNPYTNVAFFGEEEIFLWSTKQIPKLSKIVVVEASLISFLITNIETLEDTRKPLDIYYKYTLVPSSSIPHESVEDLVDIIEDENSYVEDTKFNPSVTELTKTSTETQSPIIKVGKL